MIPTQQDRGEEASHEESKPVYLPLTLGRARSPHGGASVETRHGEYDRGEGANKIRGSKEVREKRDMIMMKPVASFDEDGNAGSDKRRS